MVSIYYNFDKEGDKIPDGGLNPLRSGLGFNNSKEKFKTNDKIPVSIPSDRVLVSIEEVDVDRDVDCEEVVSIPSDRVLVSI